MPRVDHIDLVVGSLERSLAFYRELLGPLGWKRVREAPGERGETIHYLWGPRAFSTLGLRQRQSDAHPVPYDRYALGIHHLAFAARSRRVVDRRADWLLRAEAQIESGPAEYGYTPGYYAVFFYDPDGVKLEIVHRPLVRAALWALRGFR
jgi:catechol 2,3-dioxygenase-like lactoylglutathione lyase family enzyme